VVVLSPWEQAEQGRDTLEAIAEASRTRADYTQAMDRYRAIYHANPGDVHAPAAVNAVAELLAEQGRGLGSSKSDAKSLQAAVGQYEFLNKQYPASSLRAQALLAEAQIEQDDLGDAAAAREKYKLLLKEHPRSEQADEARAGLESLGQGTGNREQGTANKGAGKTTAGKTGAPATQRDENARNGTADAAARATVDPTLRDTAAKDGAAGPSRLPAMAQTSGAMEATHRDGAAMNGAPASAGGPLDSTGAVVDVAADGNAAKRSGKRAAVTGIRHWSTATYTRVAIDLGDSVTYEAARVPNPDRIYFDLHGTKLAPELVGKSFTVTDDGFLKKVRAAQYSDDVTRIVLDVNDVTEYSAFLLPNPYRLIIDIHGKKAGPAGVSIGAPQKRAEAAPTVPNTIAVKQASTAEIDAVSDLPGRVEATSKPTSKPISAVVDAGNRDQGAGNRNDVETTAATVGTVADPTRRDTAAMNGAPDSGAGVPYSVAAASGAIPQGSSKKTRRSRTKAAQSSAQSSTTVADATPARAAVPTADGETSLVRALGLKIGRIVIDAGHGGHDSGTLGADGIQEKDVVLDVALRLGKLLHDRLGAEIVYTRSDDTFIPLETRTAIANKAQADLFLSIHANSSPDASARGVETYYLNFTSDPTALDVAARENAVSDQSIHQLSDLVKKIALKDKIAESREFASDVEDSLYAGLEKGNAGLKDRGVKKAPFVVLIGANMPSILAEISFVTNEKDAEQLQQPEYRERVAESIYKGVARYEGGLSGTRVTTERAAAGQ
jgi:N-acetylmuramoyl-L-alanine amidase